MTAPRDPDPRIAAFFEATPPDLPDRTFDAIRRDIHRTRQWVVLGPLREPASLREAARFLVAAAATLAVAIVVLSLQLGAGPGRGPAPAPTPTAIASAGGAAASPTPPSGPTTFTSPLYGYTVTVPAGWLTAPALLRWGGSSQPGPDADTDRFAGPGQLTVFAFAGPFSGDLAGFVTDRMTANARDHADTCPVAEPEINEPFRIGTQPWVLLGWNCGGLINQAITVRAGVAFGFTFRDLGIKSATDPGDRALFLSILDSVELPS